MWQGLCLAIMYEVMIVSESESISVVAGSIQLLERRITTVILLLISTPTFLPTPNQLPYLRLHWLYHPPFYLFCWCSALLTLHSYALDTPPYRSNCSQRWFVTVPKLFAKVEMQLSFASCVWHEIVPELRNRKVKTICINKKM